MLNSTFPLGMEEVVAAYIIRVRVMAPVRNT